jgi:hypothetical protein
MNPIIKFFHELFNPHCSHCKELRMQEIEQKEIDREVQLASTICRACEIAQRELAIKDKLITDLIEKLTKSDEAPVIQNTGKQQIIQTRQPLPSQIRHSLEVQSRIRAEELRANITAEQNAAKPDISNEIDELEKEVLGGTNA